MMKVSRLLTALLALIIDVALSACSAPAPVETAIGNFEYEQTFMPQIDDTVAAQGNTLLVIYLTPVDGTKVDLDLAKNYFYNGTKVELAGETYGFKCLAYEKVDGSYIRFGLVFEVKDNGYADATEQPQVKLMLPPLPEETPAPTPKVSEEAPTVAPATSEAAPAATDSQAAATEAPVTDAE
jgi:hypothetical protein